MRRILACLFILAIAQDAVAQAQLAGQGRGHGHGALASPRAKAMAACLRNPAACRNTEFKTGRRFTMRDAVGLGVVDGRRLRTAPKIRGNAHGGRGHAPVIALPDRRGQPRVVTPKRPRVAVPGGGTGVQRVVVPNRGGGVSHVVVPGQGGGNRVVAPGHGGGVSHVVVPGQSGGNHVVAPGHGGGVSHVVVPGQHGGTPRVVVPHGGGHGHAPVVAPHGGAAPQGGGHQWGHAHLADRGDGWGQTGYGGGADDALLSIDVEILFDYDAHTVRGDQYAKIGELASVVGQPEFRGYRLLLIGHTDAKGSAAYNRNLSQRRAASVRNALLQFGAARHDRFLIAGRGFDDLKTPHAPYAAINRRVQLVLVPAY